MKDCMRGIMTISEYDALNHLVRQEISKDAFPEDTIQKTYTYDKRGGGPNAKLNLLDKKVFVKLIKCSAVPIVDMHMNILLKF